MVTVATFSSSSAAALLHSFLEAKGIPVFLPDEYVPQDNYDDTPPLNNIRVQVPVDYEERAAAAVEEFYKENYQA